MSNDHLNTSHSHSHSEDLECTLSKEPKVTKETLRALRKGDPEAYKTLYLHYKRPLELFLHRLTGSANDAADITQETFVTIWEIHEKIDPSKNIKSYLFTIARNMALQNIRKRKFQPDSLTSAYEDTLTDNHTSMDEIVASETELLVEVAIANMPAKRREVFNLYRQGKSYDQIAEELGITSTNVRQQVFNARKELEDIMMLIAFFFMP